MVFDLVMRPPSTGDFDKNVDVLVCRGRLYLAWLVAKPGACSVAPHQGRVTLYDALCRTFTRL